jgi:hypothetical protein
VHLPSTEKHVKLHAFLNTPSKRKIVRAGRRGAKTTGLAKAAVIGLLASFAVGNETKTKPRLTIMEGNDEFVWQMSHLRFAEWRGNVTDKDAPEKAQEKRRHLVDCLAYVLLDEPRFIDTHRIVRSQPLYNAPGSNQ